MDGFGHMNNARYFELIDTAIDLHLSETIGKAVDDPDTIGVFAEASCRFFQEMAYPAPIDLGVAVDRVGRSSIVYRVGLFQRGRDRGRGGARRRGVRRQHGPGAPRDRPPGCGPGGSGGASPVTEQDARVDAYLEPLPGWQRETLERVREVLHRTDPEMTETIQRTVQPYFVCHGTVAAFLAAKDHVNVFVYDGGLVPNPMA